MRVCNFRHHQLLVWADWLPGMDDELNNIKLRLAAAVEEARVLRLKLKEQRAKRAKVTAELRAERTRLQEAVRHNYTLLNSVRTKED